MHKLLYIDDEKHNLVTLQVSIKKWYEVFTLESPLEALELIEKEKIGVVITDQRMPGMSGLELAEKIQENFEDVIVIILTAYDDSNVMLKAINQGGIFRYMLKPYDIKDLRQTLKNAFDTYELRLKNRGLVNDLLKQNRELSLQERKYRLIFDHSPLGIAHFDKNGKITRFNKRFSEITASSCRFHSLKLLTQSPNHKIASVLHKTLETNTPETFEGAYERIEGEAIPVRAIFTPIKEEDTNDGVVMLIEDLSEIQKQEELKKQVTIAKEAARFKQNFLAEMSHEIRTPLTGVIGMTEVLRRSGLNDQQMEHVSMLRQSGDDLKIIINQVLDYSKIEAGKIPLNITTFPIKNIFQKAEKLFQSICNKPITFHAQIDPRLPEVIEGDELRIMQIINNLVTNAVKFTKEGSITLASERETHNSTSNEYTIKFSVSDTGKGIPEEMQKILFTPFTQIEDEDSESIEGTGLGLAICKELAKLHGGEIGVTSQAETGSTFWFTLRVKANTVIQTANPQQEQQENAKTIAPIKILLAEDNRTTRNVLKLLLKSQGHQITIATNGEEVLQKFTPDNFDLVIMDIQMPVMDGIAATQKLKELHQNLPPIVGLSANALEGDREKYLSLGLDEYLTKPFSQEDFHQVLKKFELSG